MGRILPTWRWMTASGRSSPGSCGRARRSPSCARSPTSPSCVRRLFERLKREGPVEVCYEAGVSGYDLYRQITALGVPCQVIAPALTPRRPGPADQDRPARCPEAGPAVPRGGADRHSCARRSRGRRPGSAALPRGGSSRRPALAASRRQVVWTATAAATSPARTGRTATGRGSAGNSSSTPRCSGPWTRPSSRSSKPWRTRPNWTRSSRPWPRRPLTGSRSAGSAASAASIRSRP